MKLVKEHINEKFTQDSDPIADMGIGINSIHTLKDLKKLFPGAILWVRTWKFSIFKLDKNLFAEAKHKKIPSLYNLGINYDSDNFDIVRVYRRDKTHVDSVYPHHPI